MEKMFNDLVSERKYETLPVNYQITKTTEEIVFHFAKKHDIDLDTAMEFLIQYASTHTEIYEENILKQSAN